MKWILFVAILGIAEATQAQQLLHQPTDSSVPAPVPAQVLNRLDDAFFNIVLQSTPQPKSVAVVIESLLDGGTSDFQSFVVGEQIGRPEVANECGPSIRRMVISFTGSHAPTGTILDGNVFLSVFMTVNNVIGAIEVVSWDVTNSAYNYYKLEGGSWRFRNSSTDLETMTASELGDGCLSCHVNGSPVMKEFTFPWNNWHGLPNKFTAPYLEPGQFSWPIANTQILKRKLIGAQVLEAAIASSLQRFINSIIEGRITTSDDGSQTVTDLPDLLDSLFMPTELNLGSSKTKSGLDGGGLTNLTTNRIDIPDSFFINTFQMRDIGLPAIAELNGSDAFTPGALAMSLAEYQALLDDNGIDTECMSGADTIFAWFGPEPSEFDRRMVERLKTRGVIDDALIAAVLAIDVEKPLISETRAALLSHMPSTITAPSNQQISKALHTRIVDSLENENARSPAEEDFLTLLQLTDPLTELDARVRRYINQTQIALATPEFRPTHLQTLFDRLLSNRQSFRMEPISRRLNEFPGLLPLKTP